MIRTAGPAIALVLAITAGWSVQGLDSAILPRRLPTGLDIHESHASASLLGQFRTTVSSWLWVRTDLYLHNGVEMRPMTEGERRSGVEAAAPTSDGHEELKDEATIVTVIPSKERDFRGLFGDIERATGAYSDMKGHHHNDPKVALPLFRLMTWIDPRFVPGWTTGAMVMARDRTAASDAQALAYLREGLRQNPNCAQILVELGRMTATRLHDLRKACEYLELACAARPVDATDTDAADAVNEAYRWLVLCYRDLGNVALEMRSLRAGIRAFPDDAVLIRFLGPPPTVLLDRARAAWIAHERDQMR